MPSTRVLVISLLLGLLLAIPPLAHSEDEGFEQADALFEEKHYAEAATLYEALAKGAEGAEPLRRAIRRLVACKLRLELYDDALDAAASWIDRAADTPWEARAERLLGNLQLRVPHWGTRSGGEFHRAQWGQGIQVRSWRMDKRVAVKHLQRARELYAVWDEKPGPLAESLGAEKAESWRDERLACLFDLAGACGRFGIFEQSWVFWHAYWAERDDFTAETAGEDEFDEYHGDWQLRRKRPIGLRLDGSGRPRFPTRPKAFSEDLDDDRKILFLLNEVIELDPTEERTYEAASLYRQAMLARARFGVDRLHQYAGQYWTDEGQPLQEEVGQLKPWELPEGETFLLAGGKIQRVDLPPDWDALALLKRVRDEYPQSGVTEQAAYAIGVTYQSRQQYLKALSEYAAQLETWPKGQWAAAARSQETRIKARQIRLHQTGVQLPGLGARVEISHRNAAPQAHFVARRIDLDGYLREVREQEFDIHKGPRDLWSLAQWHQHFTIPRGGQQWAHGLAPKYLGAEVARWTSETENDGTHRYAQAELATPLTEAGAYLVYASFEELPVLDEKETPAPWSLGETRAVVVVTDLAMVEKQAKDGKLYFVAHAGTGAPVPEAEIDIVEFWSVWNQREEKSRHFREQRTVTTDAEGLALDERPKRTTGNMHAIVRAPGDRYAWSGMRYWHWYNPSAHRSATYAYCITDRPVYRPNQAVQLKLWYRRMENGVHRNQAGASASITIFDPRGNKVHEAHGRADDFGGFAGSFRLAEEPVLGPYRIVVAGAQVVGGATFRVEEYKKPEFEVTVEPGETHAKLGDRVTAKIQARYYFGAPVTDAKVAYKVFREEYRHSLYAPGRWDWLYGVGYGFGWYSWEWFPWWPSYRCCWVTPPWWWGYLGHHQWWGPGPKPIRELVQQGEGVIGEDGTLEIEIDSGPALRDHPDRDHRYVVQAEVRDASRRVISGEGAVKVTRQAWYAMVQPLRSWVRPGEEFVVRVTCVTPENEPIVTEGTVAVAAVRFGGPDNASYERKEIERWTASTNERGVLELRLRHEGSGQLEISFEAPDQWGGTVQGHAVVWVCGEDFDGRFHRFNDLEILTDKRTYAPGETAHLMINTRRRGSHVLFANLVDSNTLLEWKLLEIPQRSIVVDLPIREGDAPNIFVEATTVAAMRVHQQVRRICVPPAKSVMDVTVETDRAEYRPGETATVRVTARTPDGEPARAQVVLSAFDSSVLYIQPELTPQIGTFFHGRLRTHQVQMQTNVLDRMSAWGNVHRPFLQLGPVPPAWYGIWGPSLGDWRQVRDEDLDSLLGKDVALFGESARSAFERSCDGRSSSGARGAAPAPSGPPGLGGAKRKAGEDKPPGEREPQDPASPGAGDDPLAEASVRKRFADTALWKPAITTGEDGTVETTVEMPENLTTWKVNAWGITTETEVGQATTSAVTTKNLIVRLQAPRFFMEYDEVVLSANVHNYLETAKRVRVSIQLPEDILEALGDSPVVRDVEVAAGGEARVDWRVAVRQEGRARITVKALTDEESDAVQMSFPALVHGMTKQVATTASMRPDETDRSITIELDVPEERRPELTRLEVQFAPSLVGAMLDALPYCLRYPYGCTEQTMSRFLPAVLTLKTLRDLGIRLEDVKKIRAGRMEEIRRIEAGQRIPLWSGYWNSPIFDDKELDRIVANGLARIASMQQGDGGWGWWSQDASNPYLTSYVLHSLLTARDCDVDVPDALVQRGIQYLLRWENRKLTETHWAPSPTHAFVAHVLSQAKQRARIEPADGDERPGDLVERLWTRRDELNLYGKALLALTLANLDDERAATVLRNILQHVEENAETQVASFRTPKRGWWYWWNNDIETHAWILRALVRIEPTSDVSPRLVKWLLNNRRNGYYWRSTRDTTFCVAAMSEFVRASGEGSPDYTLRFDLDDGAVVKEVRISRENFFTYDNRFIVEGVALSGGKHTLKVTKTGPGALYLNSYLSYFTKERPITAAGHELKVQRTYFKLQQIPYVVEVEGSDGQTIQERRLRYERVPLKDGDQVESGDLIQVELRVTSDNDYTYLAFEDMKPAGCEAVQLRSGGEGQEGFWSYMELRDEKVAFFVGVLEQGEHLLRYRLRAEVPGIFHALPTRLFAMYVPELKANGDEMVLKIVDPPEEE